MFGKFVFAFVVVYCIIQSSEAKIIALPQNSIDDILEAVNELIKNIKIATEQIEEWIRKTEELIDLLNLDDIIAVFENQIQDILDEAGITYEEANQCIEAEKEAIQDLSKQINTYISYCKEISGIEEFQRELEEMSGTIRESATSLSKNINAKTRKCVDDNKWQGNKLKKCINELVSTTKDEVNEFVQMVDEVVVGLEDSQSAYNKMYKCVTNVLNLIEPKEKIIINDFKTCIDEIDVEYSYNKFAYNNIIE